MKDLYDIERYCMDFSNEELKTYLLEPLRKVPGVLLKVCVESEERLPQSEKVAEPRRIDGIYLDGETGNFIINFYKHQTSIYISDETPTPERKWTFNEEFMFIDDLSKEHIVSSDTHGNVVYEGTLRDKSHREVLDILRGFIELLVEVTAIKIEETVVSQTGFQYPKCKYVIRMTNGSGIKREERRENILFLIN